MDELLDEARAAAGEPVPLAEAADVVVGEPVAAEPVPATPVKLVLPGAGVRPVPHVDVPPHSPGPWFVSPEGIRDANKRVIIAHSFAKTPGDLAAAALVPALEEEIRQLREELKRLTE